jgi:hemerythrin superfamily protein
MSIVDKVIAAVTPPESDEARAEAYQKARSAAAGAGDWLAMALEHHDMIRAGLEEGLAASPEQRPMAMKRLALILNGHALAEEIVLYPALAKAHEKGHANMAYTEQTATKMQMAELERLDPASNEWTEKLEHIQGALLHHMFEEEGTWFLEIKEQYDDQDMLTQRFREEYERYTGEGQPHAEVSSGTAMMN